VPRPLTWVDVCTATPMTGNGLAVVHDADGLAQETMDAFARETDLSETTFVQRPTVEGADYRNRIWMPGRELDFAGHPSLGTAVAVALARGEDAARYVQQTPSGLQPIEVRRSGEHWHAAMVQNVATFGEEVDPGRALAAVGLAPGDADRAVACQLVSTGQLQLMAPVADRAVLARVRPDAALLEALLGSLGATVLYLVAREGDGQARARGFFVQDGAVREDPATGSAAGPLMAHLHAVLGTAAIRVVQGVEMGRASVLECRMTGGRVHVGGDVVVLIRGTVAL
jgi:trans-2,3-dihydro-3-hydroxyanthranilate isomerase